MLALLIIPVAANAEGADSPEERGRIRGGTPLSEDPDATSGEVRIIDVSDRQDKGYIDRLADRVADAHGHATTGEWGHAAADTVAALMTPLSSDREAVTEGINRALHTAADEGFMAGVRDLGASAVKALTPDLDMNRLDPDKVGSANFIPQCFLLENLPHFAEQNRASNPYSKITVLDSDQTSLIVSKLNNRKDAEGILQIKPHQAAALVPKIRIYKVYKDGQGTPEELRELKFRDSLSLNSIEGMTETRHVRGDGVGIKSLRIQTQGTSPATAENLLKVEMEVFFQNVEYLTKKSKVVGGRTNPSFVDLFWYTSGSPFVNKSTNRRDDFNDTIDPHRVWNSDNFQLLLTYGWASPKGDLGPGPPSSKYLKRAIDKSEKSLWLNLTGHHIDFKQDGSVILKVEYQANVSTIMTDPLSDIFLLEDEVLLEQEKARLDQYLTDTSITEQEVSRPSVEAYERQRDALPKTEANQPTLDALNKKIEILRGGAKISRSVDRLENVSRVRKYSRIMDKLIEGGRIYSVDLTVQQISAMASMTAGAFSIGLADQLTTNQIGFVEEDFLKQSLDSQSEKIRDTVNRNAAKASGAKPRPPEKARSDYRVHYFFFGDLVELVTDIMDKNFTGASREKPSINFITGPFIFHHPMDNRPVMHVNLSDVPISFELFSEWFNNKIVQRGVDSLTAQAFLIEVLNSLLVPAMGTQCFRRNSMVKNVVGTSVFVAPKKKGSKKVPRLPKGRVHLEKFESVYDTLPTIRADNKQVRDLENYITLYITSETPESLDPRNRARDEKDGIYHLALGLDRGIVKTITFTQEDMPFVSAAKLTAGDLLQAQMRKKYNATVELIGNTLFTPGSYVYINPSIKGLGLGGPNSLSRMIGLGGYYKVINVTSAISSDTGFTTSLSCVWETFGGEEGMPVSAASSPVSAQNSISDPVG